MNSVLCPHCQEYTRIKHNRMGTQLCQHCRTIFNTRDLEFSWLEWFDDLTVTFILTFSIMVFIKVWLLNG